MPFHLTLTYNLQDYDDFLHAYIYVTSLLIPLSIISRLKSKKWHRVFYLELFIDYQLVFWDQFLSLLRASHDTIQLL